MRPNATKREPSGPLTQAMRQKLRRAGYRAAAQIIVAHELTQSMSDHGQLVALTDGIEKNPGRKPKEASADGRLLQRGQS